MTSFADISHYQAAVDLDRYVQYGYDRIILKATQGITYTDPTFTARWRRAGELGLARGAYHFAEAADDGAADFDHFIAAVLTAGGLGPADLLCLDSEDPQGTSRADEHAREFTNRAAARGYPRGCLYTGRWYADPANLQPDDLAPGWRRLWISDYGDSPDTAIILPAGWSRDQVIARQYTNRAAVPGIAGPADASRLLREWTKMSTAGPASWDAADKAAVRAIIDERMAGWLSALSSGALNSTTGAGPRAVTELAAAVTNIDDDLARVANAVDSLAIGQVDTAALAAALAGPLAVQLAEHLQLKAV